MNFRKKIQDGTKDKFQLIREKPECFKTELFALGNNINKSTLEEIKKMYVAALEGVEAKEYFDKVWDKVWEIANVKKVLREYFNKVWENKFNSLTENALAQSEIRETIIQLSSFDETYEDNMYHYSPEGLSIQTDTTHRWFKFNVEQSPNNIDTHYYRWEEGLTISWERREIERTSSYMGETVTYGARIPVKKPYRRWDNWSPRLMQGENVEWLDEVKFISEESDKKSLDRQLNK